MKNSKKFHENLEANMVLPQHHNSFPSHPNHHARTRFSCDDAHRHKGDFPYSGATRKLCRAEQEIAHRSVKSDPGSLSILMRASLKDLRDVIINTTGSAKVVRRRQKNSNCKNRTINPLFVYMLNQTGSKPDGDSDVIMNNESDVMMTRQPSSASLTSSTASLCSDGVETMTVVSDTSTVCGLEEVTESAIEISQKELDLPIELLSIDTGISAVEQKVLGPW